MQLQFKFSISTKSKSVLLNYEEDNIMYKYNKNLKKSSNRSLRKGEPFLMDDHDTSHK